MKRKYSSLLLMSLVALSLTACQQESATNVSSVIEAENNEENIEEDIEENTSENIESENPSTEEDDLLPLEEYLDLAKEKAIRVISFNSELTADINMGEDESTEAITATVQFDNNNDFKGYISTQTIKSNYNTTQNIYLEQLGDEVSIFSENSQTWTEINYDYQEALSIVSAYNGISNFNYLLDNGKNFKMMNSKNPNTIVIQGIIPKEKTFNLIENTGLFYFIGMNQTEQNAYENTEDVTFTLEFNKTGEPVYYCIYLDNLLESVSNHISKEFSLSLGEGIEIDEIDVQLYKVQQYFSDINLSQNIEIPVKARNAINYDEVITN